MKAGNGWTFDQFRDNPGAYSATIRRDIQRHLIDEGWLDGRADGVMGPATRTALDRYQQALQ
jgi:hypothetical protein